MRNTCKSHFILCKFTFEHFVRGNLFDGHGCAKIRRVRSVCRHAFPASDRDVALIVGAGSLLLNVHVVHASSY